MISFCFSISGHFNSIGEPNRPSRWYGVSISLTKLDVTINFTFGGKASVPSVSMAPKKIERNIAFVLLLSDVRPEPSIDSPSSINIITGLSGFFSASSLTASIRPCKLLSLCPWYLFIKSEPLIET